MEAAAPAVAPQQAVVPTLGSAGPDGVAGIAVEEQLRAQCYGLLGALLGAPPTGPLLRALAGLAGDGTPLGAAYGALGAVARDVSGDAVATEYQNLFIGVTAGDLVPYGSYYRTGSLHDRPLADLRGDLGRLGIARAATVCEPEDHIAFLCETMAGLITGAFGAPADLTAEPPAGLPADLDVQRAFFDRHLAPWAGRFFQDLEAVATASFYRPVGTIGRLFMDIERDAFAMAG